MKTRTGFVSNSSSSSFIITNTTDSDKNLVDFVKENPHLIVEFLDQYDWNKGDPLFTQENLIASAEAENEVLSPGSNCVVFGDEQGTLIGQVFDYILCDGGSSESFVWRFERALR